MTFTKNVIDGEREEACHPSNMNLLSPSKM
jgi:hypothetical protein